MDPDGQDHGQIHGEDGDEQILLIGGDRRERPFGPHPGPQIGSEPGQRRRPEMDRQGHRHGKDPAEGLDRLELPTPGIQVAVQGFQKEIIEKAPQRPQPDDEHGPPQAIGSGEIIGPVKHPRVGGLEGDAPQQPISGGHQDAAHGAENVPADESFRFLCVYDFRLTWVRVLQLFKMEISPRTGQRSRYRPPAPGCREWQRHSPPCRGREHRPAPPLWDGREGLAQALAAVSVFPGKGAVAELLGRGQHLRRTELRLPSGEEAPALSFSVEQPP